MIDLTIDGTSLSSIGFTLKSIDGHIGNGDPKPQGSGKEDYTSENFFLKAYRQKGNDITVECFGKFGSIAAGETALYTLYGMLVQVGEKQFVHTDGTNNISFKGVMQKGADVEFILCGGGIVYEVKLKLLKTNG